ncbi:MAG: hypothetical protein AAF726_19000 [Planctomycetota bacterium]
MEHITTRAAFATTLLALSLAACSSSDDDEAEPGPVIAPLRLPSSVSVVEPDGEAVAEREGEVPSPTSGFAPSSDFAVDRATILLYDPVFETFGDLNAILRQARPTRFTSLLNRGPYRAQFDSALVEDDRTRVPGSDRRSYVDMVYADVARPSNDEPEVGSLWLPIEDAMVPTVARTQFVVTSEPTMLDRIGDLSLNFAAVEEFGTVADPAGYGTFASASDELGFRFVEVFGDVDQPQNTPGDFALRAQLVVEEDPMAGTGAARFSDITRFNLGLGDSGQRVADTRLVYDATSVKRRTGSDPEVAFDRSQSTDHVIGYGLYQNLGVQRGDRVELETGRGVRLQSGSYAWIGYDGAWIPEGETLSDGDTVTGLDGLTTYTVRRAPGRLLRVTRGEIDLAEVVDRRFEWQTTSTLYRVAYDGVDWERVESYDDLTESWVDIVPPTTIDVAAAGGALFLYTQSLGRISYVDSDPYVSYERSEVVTGSDEIFDFGPEVSLFATLGGLRGDITQSEVDSGDVYLPTPVNVSNAHRYRITSFDMTLNHDVVGDASVLEPVALRSMVDPMDGPFAYGLRSGPLVLDVTLATMSNLTDPVSETTYFVWETGDNPWNEFVALYDSSGDYVAFDAPIQFLYSHSTVDDINGDVTYDGYEALLFYYGPGRLFGLPTVEYDADGDTFADRTYPAFSLADGTLVGPGGQYAVRALWVEQTLGLDLAGAPQLDVADADTLVLPDLTIYETPEIGPVPIVNAPPLVVDGVVR